VGSALGLGMGSLPDIGPALVSGAVVAFGPGATETAAGPELGDVGVDALVAELSDDSVIFGSAQPGVNDVAKTSGAKAEQAQCVLRGTAATYPEGLLAVHTSCFSRTRKRRSSTLGKPNRGLP
jgi:hypothetical protein